VALLFWIAVVWICWTILDWCDAQSYQWASYLNSQAPAHWRARLFTYDHLNHWITILIWIFRWIIVPAKAIPYAIASAQSGYRLPWRRVLHLLWNWRWWPAVVVAALLGVWLPGMMFAADPHGTLSAQIWRVSLKLAASYLLAMISWVLLVAWAAVLFARQQPTLEDDAITEIISRLRDSRRWICAEFGWILLLVFASFIVKRIPDELAWKLWVSVPLLVLLLIAGMVVQAGTMRSLLNGSAKRIRMIWGTLSMLFWIVTASGIAVSIVASHIPVVAWVVSCVVIPAFFIPVIATSANWGFLLPWQKILRLMCRRQWWLGLVAAFVVGAALPALISATAQSGNTTSSLWIEALRACVICVLAMGSWVLLLAWLAVLIDRLKPPITGESSDIPALVGPLQPDKQDSIKLSLPEND
jgi:hypothetical protein